MIWDLGFGIQKVKEKQKRLNEKQKGIMKVTKNVIKLYASAKAVITQFLYLPGDNRVSNVIKRLTILTEDEVETSLEKVMEEFAFRHRNICMALRCSACLVSAANPGGEWKSHRSNAVPSQPVSEW